MTKDRDNSLKQFQEKEHRLADEHRKEIEKLQNSLKELEGNLYHEKKNFDVIKEKENEIERLRKQVIDRDSKISDLEIAQKNIENAKNDQQVKDKSEKDKLIEKLREIANQVEDL